MRVSILTAGKDPHYALGLLSGLSDSPLSIDFVADDEMRASPATRAANVRYRNVRPALPPGAGLWRRVVDVLRRYALLMQYAARTDAALFHILWFNRFEWFDNVFLILYYRLLRKKLVLTVHNVNRRERDGKRSAANRWSLRFLYTHVDHMFVHTEQMKAELEARFSADGDKITVIPYGVSSFLPNSGLRASDARQRLQLPLNDRVLLFFGNIAPYKGLDILVDALELVPGCRLIIAGEVKAGCGDYWKAIEHRLSTAGLSARVTQWIRFIRDEELEAIFMAADALVLPYRRISQSGVLFLSYNFGLPVIATNVGALAESVADGVNGMVCRSEDATDLAATISRYFASPMFSNLEETRRLISDDVNRRHSWTDIGRKTDAVYRAVLTAT